MIIFQPDGKVQVVINMTVEDVAYAPANIHAVISGLMIMPSDELTEATKDGITFLLHLLNQMLPDERQMTRAADLLATDEGY